MARAAVTLETERAKWPNPLMFMMMMMMMMMTYIHISELRTVFTAHSLTSPKTFVHSILNGLVVRTSLGSFRITSLGSVKE